MRQISDRELQKVLDYIRNLPVPIDQPIAKIAAFLLDNFGWSRSQGRERAVIILEQLSCSGRIRCSWNNKGAITSIESRPAPSQSSIKRTEVCDIKDDIAPRAAIIKKEAPKLKKGLARKKRMAYAKGERNEQRLQDLVSKLLDILQKNFPFHIPNASCFRSGKNNPRKGKIDLQDKSGEDVSPLLTIRTKSGHFLNKRIIYDAKSSEAMASKFNKRIIYFPGQKDASLKKAIVINDRRSDKEIVKEILDDFLAAEILSREMSEQAVNHFSETAFS